MSSFLSVNFFFFFYRLSKDSLRIKKIGNNNLNIDAHNIHNLAHLLYCNGDISCFGYPSCDLSQDRQLEGLPSS